MGILSSLTKNIAKVGLAVPVAIGNLITTGIEKVTGKEYGRQTLEEASKTTTGKLLGTSIAAGTAIAAGAAITGSAAATATLSKVTQVVSKAINPFTSSPTVKAGIATAATVAVLAPETAKAIFSSPEATKTAAAAIVSPAAGLIVGLEQGGGLLSSALDTALPKVAATLKQNTPEIIAAATTLGVAAASAAALLPEKSTPDVSTLPIDKITAIPATTQPNTAVAAPVLPETQILKATTGAASTSTRKKRRSNLLQSKISQSVRVNILNQNSAHRITKRYLNVIPLRN